MENNTKSKEDIYLEEVNRACKVDEKFGKVLFSDAIRKFTLNCLTIMENQFRERAPSVSDIGRLIEQYKKEQLPSASEPFHHEAEIAAGFKYFLLWLEKRIGDKKDVEVALPSYDEICSKALEYGKEVYSETSSAQSEYTARNAYMACWEWLRTR